MKLVREYINEKFTEDSDPIQDMSIGLRYKIKEWLKKYNINHYIINDDLTIDVNDNIFLKHINKFPEYINFNKVHGSVSISNSEITNLRGCPQYITGFFSCYGNNKLISLEGGPQKILIDIGMKNDGYGYACNHNKLISFKGLPKKIDGNLWIYDNAIKFKEEDIIKVCKVSGVIEV